MNRQEAKKSKGLLLCQTLTYKEEIQGHDWDENFECRWCSHNGLTSCVVFENFASVVGNEFEFITGR